MENIFGVLLYFHFLFSLKFQTVLVTGRCLTVAMSCCISDPVVTVCYTSVGGR